jgi:hypothetical protein
MLLFKSSIVLGIVKINTFQQVLNDKIKLTLNHLLIITKPITEIYFIRYY